MRVFRFIIIALLGGALAACATIVDGGPTKPVTITSQPSGKSFTVTDLQGKVVQRGKTPATIELPRTDGSYFGATRYKVTMDGSGASADVKSSITAWYLAGNVMVGGLVGWFIVDPLTDSMYTLKPSEVNLR